MFVHLRAVLTLAVLATAVLPALLEAQGVQTGVLTGVVRDPDALPVPGATVVVTSPALLGERTATTDEIGAYILRGLPPGNYTVRFELPGTTPVVREDIAVPLGGVARLDVTLQLAGVAETVSVVAEAAPPLATTQRMYNLRTESVNTLPVGRRPFEIAELAPGVTDNTPNVGQMAIGGAFAYDSLFLIDGVDTNDNLFGSSNPLFIEDAIQETQVLTSGISAEYGRFGGGVINVITKSGGNRFSGSFRTNFSRPSWTSETPFERERNINRSETLSKFYEGTIGGPIVLDRLWFFNANRYENSVTGQQLSEVGTAYNTNVKNKRWELKLTGAPYLGHTVSGTFLNNPTDQNGNPSINATFATDLAVLVNRQLPNNLWVVNWNGVLTDRLFGTLQWSRKEFGFRNTGGTETAIRRSPFLTRGLTGMPRNRHYNAPYFDANDPEDRNNNQVAGSVSYFLSSPTAGRHDMKAGFERFKSFRTGGNSQSATGYVFQTDYLLGADGRPVLTSSGSPVPVWGGNAANPGAALTRIQNWLPTRGATINIRTLSFYLQDRWTATDRWTFDLGLRFEKVDTIATGDIVGADTSNWLPRFGASFDLEGNGRTIAQATYGRYAGRFTEAQFARNTPVGTPSLVLLAYTGPNGTGYDFAPGFDLNNYVIIGGNFPTANVFFDPDLKTPTTNEFTLSLGRELPRTGYAKVTYVWRDVSGFIEDVLDDPTAAGKVTVVRDGRTFGTFDRVVWKNTDAQTRKYQALQFESRVRVLDRLPVEGHWTVQLRNHGNFEGEAANQPGIGSIWFDYPELFNEARYYPYGRLDEFQRHKVRIWTIYSQGLGRFGSVDVAPIWRINSGLTYSLFTNDEALTATQLARNPGYARTNPTGTAATLFYGARGSESFKGYGLLDIALSYGVPVWQTLRPWIQLQVFNVLDNDKLIQWDTSVTPDPNSPRDELGQPTGYIRGANFGRATSAAHFPRWGPGQTGGRTYRLAMGIRF